MAWIKIKQPKRRGAAASQLTPRSQKKRSSAHPQPASVPDVPSPLGELPAEGGRNQGLRQEIWNDTRGLGARRKSLGLGDRRDLASRGSAVPSRDLMRRRAGGKRGAA